MVRNGSGSDVLYCMMYDCLDKASICLICAAGKGEERKGTGSGLLTFGDS